MDPKKGTIFFSMKGYNRIKATGFMAAITKTVKGRTYWYWPWDPVARKYLRKLSDDYRLTKEDVSEFTGSLEGLEKMFQHSKFNFSSTTNTEIELRAKCLEILDGKYVYEAEVGNGRNAVNIIFILSGVKQIKEKIPEARSEAIEEVAGILKNGTTKKVTFESSPQTSEDGDSIDVDQFDSD